MLVPEFTVEENFALASPDLGPVFRSSDLAAKALEIGGRLGWTLDPKSKTRSLSVGLQQRLEILKALATEAPTLIFDEPTAVLQGDEVDELFRVLRRLREEGRTVILIAHKLAEVLAIANRITVLRQGTVVVSVLREEADAEKLTFWMLGERPPLPESIPGELGETVLEATNLGVKGARGEWKLDGLSLKVRRGEILGIGGVDGNGQVELAEALAGVRSIDTGTLKVQGKVAYIPQDRHRDGLALEMTVEENLLIEGHRHPDLQTGAILSAKKVRPWAEGLRKKFEVAAPNVAVQARNLSGGNQQKVVVARTFDANPDILVAVNPTRGLDLRATAFVRHQLRLAAQSGAAVVLISTDLDELEEVASRRLFLESGKLFEDFMGDRK